MSDPIDEDSDFKEDFYKVFHNTDIPQSDDNTSPDILDDSYANMEIALARGKDGPQFTRVTKRLRDTNGVPIGTANNKPILDTRLFKVRYLDTYKASLSANTKGNRFVLMESIEDHKKGSSY